MTTARTYLDYNASAPLRREARAAMLAALDAAAIRRRCTRRVAPRAQSSRRRARRSRASSTPSRAEVVFTSGATEANNADALGRLGADLRQRDRARFRAGAGTRLGREGRFAAGRRDGVIDVAAAALHWRAPREVARCCCHGCEQRDRRGPAGRRRGRAGARARCRRARRCRAGAGPHGVRFRVARRRRRWRCRLTRSAVRAGVGAARCARGILPAFITGGGQERRRRGGTENVAGIAGFGAAAEAVVREEDAAERMANLRVSLEAGVCALTPAAVIVGVERDAHRQHLVHRAARQLGRDAGDQARPRRHRGQRRRCVLLRQGRHEPCAGGHGAAPEIARSAIRVSLGPETTEDDIAAFLAAWEKIAKPAAIAA